MKALLLLLIPVIGLSQATTPAEIARWQKQAKNVTIIRDNYGVPHIYGKTDADAVFGLLYAQCEDDIKRVEMNYIEKLGGVAAIKGEKSLYNDLLNRIIISEDQAKANYRDAPLWLKKLCDAFADAINYYIYKHPDYPALYGQKYQPWFPFLWTDGSIGAISTADITMDELQDLYKADGIARIEREITPEEEKLTGSNGFAFAPKITEHGKAILYINPHVTFYFRPEVHMVSEEGLNVYGAVTWGQFFIYQGFNEHCGWMHTSAAVDAADSYIEKLTQVNGKWFYEYNGKKLPVIEKQFTIVYKKGTDLTDSRSFKVLYTAHGPIMAKRNGQYLSLRADNQIMNGLIQCWQRNKSNSFSAFKKTLDLRGNISNNTVYADAEGNIAYWHGNRIPKRNMRYDWSKPVDGTTSATEWTGLHPISEIVQSINPPNGWLQNCNSTPFTVAGANSPKKENYPAYMAPDAENFRGINAVRVLSSRKDYTIDKVIAAGYDTRLAAFELLIPNLVAAFQKEVPVSNPKYKKLSEPLQLLQNWDYRCSETSTATTLAILWATKLTSLINGIQGGNFSFYEVEKTKQAIASINSVHWVAALDMTITDLENTYGSWQVKWGDINRFQRINNTLEDKYDDSAPSYPVGFASSLWGCLPSYKANYFPGTKKLYGVNGNSFVCAVEFGKRIKAKSLLAGGESGDPASPHFFDQGLMYSKGQFKDVLFYKEDVLKKAERTYHPGE